jgi:hypothetical protein
MTHTKETFVCYHCGNQGMMKEHGVFVNSGDENYFIHEEYKLFECPVCCSPLVFHSIISDDEFDIDDKGHQVPYEHIIFPDNKLKNRAIPQEIRDAYESALRTKTTDTNIVSLALRRTLELITKDKGATGANLEKKIEDLANKGILPTVLKNAATITRLIGNDGAHGAQKDVTDYDMEKLLKLVEYIIEYIYVLPDDIARLDRNNKLAKSNFP